MSRIEVLVLIAVLAILAALVLPMANKPPPSRDRGNCIVRLKALGIGLSQYADDHGGNLPWQVSVREGGSADSSAFQYYQSASNYLSAPSQLACPQDDRPRSASWGSFGDSNISYFVNLSADLHDARRVLSGDRYLTTNTTTLSGVLDLHPETEVKWAKDFHNFTGNLLFVDGSAAWAASNVVEHFFLGTNRNLNRLIIP